MSSMQVELKNATTSNTVYAYITGYAIDEDNKLVLISADGKTPYFPPSPPGGSYVQPVPQDCAIPLGPPNTSVYCTIPHIGGCRVWFSVNDRLCFHLNPGPALVEPSCTNTADSNINVVWAFAELTFNPNQCFANVSYVDFVSLPVSVTLTTTDGRRDHVAGMAVNGLDNICRSLKSQEAIDGQPWSSLIVNNSNGRPLRVLSPNNALEGNPKLFSTYFQSYVDKVYAQYATELLSVDTQAQWGIVKGQVSDDAFIFDGISFDKPSTADIFSCSTGPFADGCPEKLCITPRLAAGFNRATLLSSFTTPDPQGPATFYKNAICNHYARIVHEQLLDSRGYAFPYDDVCQDQGPDQCGAVYDSNPQLLTISVGGNGASVTPGSFGAPTYD